MSDSLKVETAISLVSAVGAIGAALFAFRSNIIANRALKLAESEQRLSCFNITTYLIESFRQKIGDIYLIAFAVEYLNKSKTNDSIRMIELAVTYKDSDGNLSKIILPSLKNDEIPTEYQNITNVSIPLRLEQKSAASVWIMFKIPNPISSYMIEEYKLLSATASDRTIEQRAYLVKEIIDNED